MYSSRTVPDRSFHARLQRYRTAGRLLPYVFRHIVSKPFRSSAQAREAAADLRSTEFRRPAHDMYCEMFLNGYRQATASPVDRSTGLALVLFMVFIFTFDQEFERARKLGAPPDYQALIDAPRVADVWNALRGYLRAFGRDQEILGHVFSTFARNYDDYRCCVAQAVRRGDFATTVGLAELDSGLTLQTIYEIIRLFNGHQYRPECARQFFALGMAGKFLDDIRDMVDDVAAGDPNLLYALTLANDQDQAALAAALRDGTRITMWWWSRNCRATLETYISHMYRYYDQVTDSELRLSLDVCVALLHSRRYWRRPIHRRPATLP